MVIMSVLVNCGIVMCFFAVGCYEFSYSEVVITLDFESSIRSSNLRRRIYIILLELFLQGNTFDLHFYSKL